MMFGGRPRVIDEVEAGCAAILQALRFGGIGSC